MYFGVALAVYGRQAHKQQSKTLDWILKTDEPIVAAGAEQVRSGLTIQWEGGIPLKHPRLVVLRIINTGKREVVESDYDTPITISILYTAIISATVTSVSHPGVYPIGPLKPLNVDQTDTVKSWADTPVR